MARNLEEQVVIITGGGAGIGRASALAVADRGAKVAVLDMDEKGGDATRGMIVDRGGAAIFIRTDVSDEESVKKAIQGTVDRLGRIDGAFNNAGIEGEQCPAHLCSAHTFDKIMNINLRGVWLCMKYEIEQMLNNGGGSIINNASIAGLKAFPKLTAYVASKHGVIGLTRSAAMDYAEQGIRVNTICPGVIRTAMVERVVHGNLQVEALYNNLAAMKRMGKPEEIADTVCWLLSNESSFVTGANIVVDGGVAI